MSRHDIGREAFLERVWEFVNAARARIAEQHRRLGASADWDREAFTLDEARQRAVRQTFVNLYEDGLIFRGERMINWDTAGQTALSDLEVEYRDVESSFWYVRYPALDEAGEPTDDYIVIATTRPETIPADTAVAVHPDDERWRHLIGRMVLEPTSDRPIAVIADEAIEIEAGSGALKVTPGHDPVDFEIGERHGLETINILAPDGTLNEHAGRYAGIDRFEARDRVVADLEAKGLIEKIEPYTHAVGHSQRSGAVVEPIVSEQWWVNVGPLAEPAIAAVRDGRHRVRAEALRAHLPALDGEHPATGASAARSGGAIASPSGTATPRSAARPSRPSRDPDACPACGGALRQGRGHPRHVVLVRAVAALDARLAGRGRQGSAALLPDTGDGDRLRHHLLLGRAHDHALALQHARLRGRRHPLRDGLPARPRARAATGARCPSPSATSSTRSA